MHTSSKVCLPVDVFEPAVFVGLYVVDMSCWLNVSSCVECAMHVLLYHLQWGVG